MAPDRARSESKASPQGESLVAPDAVCNPRRSRRQKNTAAPTFLKLAFAASPSLTVTPVLATSKKPEEGFHFQKKRRKVKTEFRAQILARSHAAAAGTPGARVGPRSAFPRTPTRHLRIQQPELRTVPGEPLGLIWSPWVH